jgi:D-alanyl-D-alanine carboxypeptidase
MHKQLIQILYPAIIAIILFSCSKESTTEPLPELTFDEKLQLNLDLGTSVHGGKGLSAAVLIPGEPIWLGVSGESHGSMAVTSDMVFSAGSITKMFTAATIMHLVEELRVSLDDSLHQWLPSFDYIDSTITIRQLLNHTNGIFNITEHPQVWNEMISNSGKIWIIEEAIHTYIMPPYFPKGTGWAYSNTGYTLLRMIIQEVTGSQISSQYRNRFFVPFGLDRSYLYIEESLPSNVAHGWWDIDGDGNYDDLSQLPMTALYSAIGGGIFCTAEDLARWAHAFFHMRSVVKQNSYTEMMNFYSPCPGEPMARGYGLGVVQFEPSLFNDLEIWGHGGNAPGYAAACFYLPAYEVSIGIMDNTEYGDGMQMINDFLTVITDHLDQN